MAFRTQNDEVLAVAERPEKTFRTLADEVIAPEGTRDEERRRLLDNILTGEFNDIVSESRMAKELLISLDEPQEDSTRRMENKIMLSALFDIPINDVLGMDSALIERLYGKSLEELSAAVVNKNLKEDITSALKETPMNLWIGTIGMSAGVLESMKRRSIGFSGGGLIPGSDEAIKHQFEAITPDLRPGPGSVRDPNDPENFFWNKDKFDFLRPDLPLPGAITSEAFGLVTRLPDIGAKIIRSKQKELQAEQDIATISNAPITKLSRLVQQSGVPSMGVAVGVSLLTGNPMVGLVILGETEGGAAFQRQLEEGGSVRKALIIGELSEAAEIGGEMLVLPKLVRGLKEGISIRKALTLIAENTLQEGVTGFNQEFLSVFGTETTKGTDLALAAKKAFVAGYEAIPENAFVGGATAGLVDIAATPVTIARGRRAGKAEAKRTLDDIAGQVKTDIDAEIVELDAELAEIQRPARERAVAEPQPPGVAKGAEEGAQIRARLEKAAAGEGPAAEAAQRVLDKIGTQEAEAQAQPPSEAIKTEVRAVEGQKPTEAEPAVEGDVRRQASENLQKGKIIQKVSGEDVAKYIQDLGTEDGVSDWLVSELKSKDFVLKEVDIDDIIKADPSMAAYIEDDFTRYEEGKFDEEELDEPPIIGTSNTSEGNLTILDGMNRIYERNKKGEKTVVAYVEVAGETIRDEPGFAGGGPLAYENLPASQQQWLAQNELVEEYKKNPQAIEPKIPEPEAKVEGEVKIPEKMTHTAVEAILSIVDKAYTAKDIGRITQIKNALADRIDEALADNRIDDARAAKEVWVGVDQIKFELDKRAKPEAKVEGKRIISKDAFEKAKKRLTDNTTFRTGLDPQGLADLFTVGAYHIETGIRTFAEWSKKMLEDFGQKARPYLQDAWLIIQAERKAAVKPGAKAAKPSPRVEMGNERLRQQIDNAAKEKGLTRKALSDLKLEYAGYRTLTGKIAVTKITGEQLQDLLRAVILNRPNVIGHETVITVKTEVQIEQLKESLTKAGLMNDTEFENILGVETSGRLPKYISAKAFVTQTKGRAVINRMHDVAERLRATESYNRALEQKPEIGLEHDKLKDRTESILGIKSPARLLSMRYFVQKMSERSGDPIYHIYQDLIFTQQKAMRERRKLLNTLEELPGFVEIAANERALQRVSDFISSLSTLIDKPNPPRNITQNEIAVAKRIQEIFKLYELQARLGKFFQFKDNLTKMPQYLRYKKQIDLALEIYDTQGLDPLVEYLKTQPWGIIRSGYEPMESVVRKVSTHRMPDIAVGKAHIKVRGIEYTKQDRNILQRLDTYMRQMDMLSFLQPKIKALVRTTSDSLALYDDPTIVSNAISTFLDNIKRTNNEDGLVEEVMRKIYSQAITTLVLADPSKPVRNLHQNAAFAEDRRDFVRLVNKLREGKKLLTPEETEYLQTFVHQDRVMLSDWAFTGEEPFDFPGIGQFRFGINRLTKWVQRRTLYPGSDRINRTMSFAAKIHRVKTAFAKKQTLAKKLKEARFSDMQKQEQQLALGLLARDGIDAMARYIAKVHTDNTHFLYAREQRSPAEQTKLGKMFLNLFLFKRAAIEKAVLQLQKTVETGATFEQRRRAALVFVNLIVWSILVNLLWKKTTGKKWGAYDYINFLEFEAGGLQLGTIDAITDVYNNMLRSGKGDTKALGALAVAIPKAADMLIPFYDLGLRAIEATLGTEHIDRVALRKIREMIDVEYKSRGLEEVDRTLVEKLQFFIAKGKPKDEEPSGTRRKPLTTKRRALKTGRRPLKTKRKPL